MLSTCISRSCRNHHKNNIFTVVVTTIMFITVSYFFSFLIFNHLYTVIRGPFVIRGSSLIIFYSSRVVVNHKESK